MPSLAPHLAHSHPPKKRTGIHGCVRSLEQWPDTAEDQFFNGRRYQQILHAIRKDGVDGRLTINDIYSEHPELWSWWNRPDPKHNQR